MKPLHVTLGVNIVTELEKILLRNLAVVCHFCCSLGVGAGAWGRGLDGLTEVGSHCGSVETIVKYAFARLSPFTHFNSIEVSTLKQRTKSQESWWNHASETGLEIIVHKNRPAANRFE